MKRIHFSIKIKAPRKKVWDVLWTDETYRKWTSVFSDGSYAVTDWEEGSKVLFLSPGGEGMFSKISRKIPEKTMAFKHLGVVKDGKEAPLDDETKQWSGALEKYTLKENKGSTELLVEMDVTDDHQKYFKETFPKALEKVKELSEK